MQLGAQLVPPSTCEAQCFILGSYNEDEKAKLLHAQRKVERWGSGNYRAYLMEDFADGLHPMIKFRLIADYSDHIIGICEHDQGGFQLELGMLVALMGYFDQCHLLKRKYSPKTEREQYNWMLDAGVFEMFDYGNRLREWEDGDEFSNEVSDLLFELL